MPLSGIFIIQPDHIQALNNLAFVYASKGENEKAIASLLHLAGLQPDDPNTYYNVASLYARQDRIAESIEWLEAAFKKGYKNCHLIKTDEDLKNVRTSLGYTDLLNRYCR